MSALHPMQPLERDDKGAVRFRRNAIVEYMLDWVTALAHPGDPYIKRVPKGAPPPDLNVLACMEFSDEDRMQFAQLIGYSVSGYGELSYVSEESLAQSDVASDILDEPQDVDPQLLAARVELARLREDLATYKAAVSEARDAANPAELDMIFGKLP